MSLLRQPAFSTFSQAEWDQAAAERETGFGTYLGAKVSQGFDYSILGRATEALSEPQGLRPYADEFGNVISQPPGPGRTPLSEEAWKTGRHFRKELSYEPGLTEEVADARARAFDRRRWRDSLVQRYQSPSGLGYVAGFGAAMLGGAPSPENFIPFVGPAWRAAAVARLGVIGGRAATSAADALIGTAVADAVVLPDLARRGEDIGIADLALDLALGAVLGGTLGTGAGVLERRALLRRAAVATRVDGVPPLLDQLALVADAIVHDEPLPPIVGIEARLRQRLLGGTAPVEQDRGPLGGAELTIARRLADEQRLDPEDALVETLTHAALRDDIGRLLDAAGIKDEDFSIPFDQLPGRHPAGAGVGPGRPGAAVPGAAGGRGADGAGDGAWPGPGAGLAPDASFAGGAGGGPDAARGAAADLEARSAEALDREIRDAVAAVAGERGLPEAAKVRSDIRGQLVALAVPAEEAGPIATLWGEFFAAMGRRAGVAPTELYRRYQVAVQSGGEAPEGSLLQSVALREGREDLSAYGIEPGTVQATRRLAEALEARTRTQYRHIERGDYSAEAETEVAGHIVDETLFELRPERAAKNGAGWYSWKFAKALDTFGAAFPELLGEDVDLPGARLLRGRGRVSKKQARQNARDFFTAIIAITSDGQKAVDNFRHAVRVFDVFRRTGRMPERVTFGADRNKSINLNIRNIQKVLDELGPVEMHRTLMREDSVSNLNKRAKAANIPFSADYPAQMQLPYAAVVFGPKLGAFYANLMGSHGYLTMDRWWSRTFNRYRGTLIPIVSGTADRPTDARGNLLGLARYKQLIGKSEIGDAEALEIAKVDRASYEERGFKHGPDVPEDVVAREKAANTLVKDAFISTEDMPFSTSDRAFMIRTVQRAQQQLAERGQAISIADIQAVLWYYEKRLYAELGARSTPDESYAEIAQRVVGEHAAAGGVARDGEGLRPVPGGEPGAAAAGAEGAGTVAGAGATGADSPTPDHQEGTLGDETLYQSGALDLDTDARRARAQAQGFDTSRTWFHGSEATGITAFDPGKLGENTGAASATRGFFFTSGADTADAYLGIQRGYTPEAERKADKRMAKIMPALRKRRAEIDAELERLGVPYRTDSDSPNSWLAVWGRLGYPIDDPHFRQLRDLLWEEPPEVEEYNKILKFLERRENYQALPKGAVYPVHLRMENPFIHDFAGQHYREVSYDSLLQQAIAAGHDSAIFKNTFDPGPAMSDIAVVFSPEQIRSVHAQFDPAARASSDLLRQAGPAGPRGAITFAADGRTIIRLFQSADRSTFLHESGHLFLRVLQQLAEGEKAPRELVDDWGTLRRWLDLAEGESLQVAHHEQLAEAFETYLATGRAPTERLKGAFQAFASWLRELWRGLTSAGVRPSAEVRQVFDRMLGAERGTTYQNGTPVPPLTSVAERAPPVPPSVLEAAARLGQRPTGAEEDLKLLAQDLGVAPKDGGVIPEMADVDELRRQGRVTAEDEADLVEADEVVKEADGWATAYEQLATCVLRYEG
jgi:hypothetical protein